MMWNDEWCALLEPTNQFVHGETDFYFDEPTGGPFVGWPLIALETQGCHHQGEQILASYAYNYDANPCGVSLSTESLNGWQIHAGDGAYGTCATLGQAMEWLGPSGGGFAIAYIQEPYGIEVNSRTLYKNLFINRLTWGEAALGWIVSIGEMTTVLGDPLARLVVHNPDVNGDRIVNTADYQIVLLALGTSNPQADINHDGIVNQADINLVREAYGRNCTEPPTEPYPNFGCGDLVNEGGAFVLDGLVTEDDLDAFHAIWTALNGMTGPADCPLLDCWAQCPCEGDFNGDAIIDSTDEDIVEANAAAGGTYLYDFNDDGCFNVIDSDLFFDYIAQLPESGFICDNEPQYNPLFDINCDGCVGSLDLGAVVIQAQNPTFPCPP